MKQVILEYGGSVIALIGMLSFFLVFQLFFVGRDGVLGQILAHSIGETRIVEEGCGRYQSEKYCFSNCWNMCDSVHLLDRIRYFNLSNQ